jgi:predicted transcriptional regulator
VNGGITVRFLVVLAIFCIVVGTHLVDEEKNEGDDGGATDSFDKNIDGNGGENGSDDGDVNVSVDGNSSDENTSENNSGDNDTTAANSDSGGGGEGDSSESESASDASSDGEGDGDGDDGSDDSSSSAGASSEPDNSATFDSEEMGDDPAEDTSGTVDGGTVESPASRSIIPDLSIPEGLVVGGGAALGSLAIGALFAEVMKVAILVGLVVPVMAARRKNREDMMTRGRLLGYLEANAGIHFSALRDALGLANGVSAYHLQVLESNGQIISWRDGKLRRYAVASLSKEEAERVKNPIAGTRLAILEVLADSGNIGLSGSEIRIKLAISRQLLSHHLAELRSAELVEAASQAKRPKWRVSLDGQDTLDVSRQIARAEAVA